MVGSIVIIIITMEIEEMRMLRRILGVSLNDKERNEVIRKSLKVTCTTDKLRDARFRWYGYVMRREDEHGMNRIMTAEVTGRCSRGQQKKEMGRHNTGHEVFPIEERRYW